MPDVVYERSFESSDDILANTVFQAIATDYATVIPAAAPCTIASIVKISGDPGPRRIEQINFYPGQEYVYLRTEVIIVDTVNLFFKFDVSEGDFFRDLFNRIEVEIRIQPTEDAEGSTSNVKVVFYAFKEADEEVDKAMKNAEDLFHAVVDYLKQMPDA